MKIFDRQIEFSWDKPCEFGYGKKNDVTAICIGYLSIVSILTRRIYFKLSGWLFNLYFHIRIFNYVRNWIYFSKRDKRIVLILLNIYIDLEVK